MAVSGKVFTLFRPLLRFSISSKSSRSFCLLAVKTNFKYSTLNNPSLCYIRRQINPMKNSCYSSRVTAMTALSPLDPSSYSRPEIAVVTHTSFSLNVDFEQKVLSGTALISVNVLEDTGEVILDTSNLTINCIELEDCTPLKYTLGDDLPNYGSKLTIKLPKTEIAGESTDGRDIGQQCTSLSFHDTFYKIENQCSSVQTDDESENSYASPVKKLSVDDACTSPVGELSSGNDAHTSQVTELSSASVVGTSAPNNTSSSGTCDCKCPVCVKHGPEEPPAIKSRFKIKIDYASSKSASALQWLEPSQTSGKKHPYLFSQCQPIHARSIIPCQDTPAVKFTYDAEVTAPEEFTVLMSALRGENRGAKTTFRQPVPIPAYLLAIAVGVLESRELGPRSKVWSEKEEIERSAWEFAETEKYLQAAERLCGPYVWTQYDLLVLPPSFPYGGMENPCLTFVTPTLLAGDRSLANVLVHEIMHSWTGNLVTNRNFEHFWLNEGFTVFTERKVDASLISDSAEAKKNRDFQSLLGLQELTETVNTLGATNPLTQLQVNLKGVHPDDAFSRIPYEKGSLFLRYLEDLVGGPEVFDDFLRSYLNHFQRKSLDTDQFKAYLLKYFGDNEKLKAVDWQTWFNGTGMPPVIPDYDTSMTKAITTLLGKIDQGHEFTYEDVKGFTPHQIIHLLQELVDRPPLSIDRLRNMGRVYKIDTSNNAEIKYRWTRLCVRSKDIEKLPEALDFINKQGRMKYVRPVYRDLYAWEEVRQQAIDNFLANEKYMMHVSAYTLRKDLHLSE